MISSEPISDRAVITHRALLLVLLICCSCFSYTTNAQVTVRNFLVPDGLPQTQVYCIAGDSLGYLWLGTLGGGAASFDGRKFNKINVASGLPSDIVMDIQPDSKGVWIATQKGIARYNFNRLISFPLGLQNGNYPVDIFVAGDSLIIRNTDNSLSAIVNDSLFHEVALPRWSGIRSVKKSYSGVTMLHRTAGDINELILLKSKSRESIKLPAEITSVFSLFSYHHDWVISTNSGLYKIIGDSVQFFREYRFPVFRYSHSGDFFVGKENNKLVIYGRAGRKVLGDFKAIVKNIRNDDDGTTWLGTDKGLYRITFPSFTRVGTHRTPEPVMSVHALNGQLWVGTSSQGVEVYQDTTRVHHFDLGSVRRNYVTSVKSDQHGAVYFGTGGGVARNRNGITTWLSPSLIESSASLAVGSDDRVVIASSVVGAYWAKGDSSGRIEGLAKDVIQSVDYNASLDAYVFGTNNGLKRMDGLTVTSPDVPEFRDVQLSSVRWVSDDVIAVGSYGHGFSLYSFAKNKIILSLTEKSGLASNTIFVVQYFKEKFWVGTIAGIDLIELSPDMTKVIRIRHFDEGDGLFGLETNQDAVTLKDSTIYFGLVTGVYRFNGESIESNPHGLRLTQAALFFNKPVSLSAGKHVFTSDENHLTFTFNKVDKGDPDDLFYRYTLEGFDQVWSDVTQNGSVTYGNLPPGNFVFNVTTTDKSGTFTFDTVRYPFTISAPFYRTWWFGILVVIMVSVLLMGCIILYNKWKFAKAVHLQKLKEQERDKLRKEIARDFHDEIGNQVARIINYVSVMRISNSLMDNVYETLSRFSQGIFQGTRDFVWALDPANDDLENVVIHLKDFGEQMFQEKSIGFSFHRDIASPVKLPLGFSRQINLVMKEAMTNAFRHSDATAVDFFVVATPNKITITLKDDGKGIGIADPLHSKRGLENMSVRAKRINAILRVSNGDPGTIVELEMNEQSLSVHD